MLRRQFRLRHAADFRYLRQHGQRYRHPLVILLAVSNDRPVSRFAFQASRRYGNAVQRNRARRVLRAAVQRHLPALGGGIDCLLIARAPLTDASFVAIDEAVASLFRRANLLPGPGQNTRL